MTEQDRQKLIKTIQNFRLIDDTYFNIYMDGNPQDMQFILRIIENDPELQVIDLYMQREVPNIYGRSVRFDAFVRSAAGIEYNIEIQRDSSGASPERARFNRSMLDARVVQKGFKWDIDHLPPAKVIFITEQDTEGAKFQDQRTWGESNVQGYGRFSQRHRKRAYRTGPYRSSYRSPHRNRGKHDPAALA